MPASAEPAGLEVEVDFGPLWGICAQGALAASPTVAAGLSVTIAAHRSEEEGLSQVRLAEDACRLLASATDAGPADGRRFYADVLMALVGGAGYVEPGAERLNVQQLLPPASLLLVVMAADGGGEPADAQGAARAQRERGNALLGALRKLQESGTRIGSSGDDAFSALFGAHGGVLDERETTMIYGLMRVQQMTEAFLECLGEPFVDNDRLAEICDEESAILADYFGFPAAAFEDVRAAAAEEGALGTKLTWAFGSVPAAIVLAPGRRGEVGRALARAFREARCLPVDMATAGLLRAADEGWTEMPAP